MSRGRDWRNQPPISDDLLQELEHRLDMHTGFAEGYSGYKLHNAQYIAALIARIRKAEGEINE